MFRTPGGDQTGKNSTEREPAMNNPQEQALREALAYILNHGSDADMAPVIELLDAALSAVNAEPTKEPVNGEEGYVCPAGKAQAASRIPQIQSLLRDWEGRANNALPSDAMLINRHIRELRAALSIAQPAAQTVVPEEATLVPWKPTNEMLAAGIEEIDFATGRAPLEGSMEAAYRAMIAAAPQPVAAQVVAWMRNNLKECITAESKRQMESADFGSWKEIAKSYTIPLYFADHPQAAQAKENGNAYAEGMEAAHAGQAAAACPYEYDTHDGEAWLRGFEDGGGDD